MPQGSQVVEPTFESQASEIMQRVRSAVAHLSARLTGKSNARAADLVEALQIDTRLAWKFVKIVEKQDALVAVRYVPGPRGVKLFLNAAARKPGATSAVEAAKAAFQEFDALVRREAGDRRSFDMMAANHERSSGGDLDLEHRKGAFTHNSYIWGVQAQAQVHTYLIRPSDDGEHLDAAIVRGFVGLRRVRPHIPWRISRFFTIDDTGHVRSDFTREPIDDGAGEVPLLRAFCSRPLPRVRRIVGQEGVIDYVLEESDVGNTRAVTCLTGELIRKAEPCYPDERHAGLGAKTPLRTPSEAVVTDLYLDRNHFRDASPSLTLVSDMFAERLGMVYTKTDELPLADPVETLGSAAEAPPVPEMPHYSEMIRHCFTQLGWDARQFNCYRVRVEYPPLPTALILDTPLPARPK